MSSEAQRRRPIALVPFGRIDSKLMSWLVENIRGALGRDVILAERLSLPAHAFTRQRDQWHATTILDALANAKRPEWLRLLGIVDVDLYASQLNFVFGEADPDRGVAVFSTARLHAGQLYRRAGTEAIHELGHTFGLGHCSRPSCVMWFSNTLAETDRKDPHPCPEHARALSRALEADS